MIEWSIDGVHLSKSLKNDPQALARLRPALAMSRILARHIQARVARGRVATPATRYDSEGGYRVTERYAEAAGASTGAAGTDATKFASAADFQAKAGALGKPGVATGGLLRSIRVRNLGSKGAIIEPAGSSLARSRKTKRNLGAAIKTVRERAREQVKQRKTKAAKDRVRERRDAKIAKLRQGRPRNIQNRKKASTVWRQLKINITQPTDRETQALVSAVAGMAQHEVAAFFGATVLSAPRAGDSRLLRKLRSRLRG